MNEELARWVVAAFMSNPDAGHDELVAALRAAGVPRAHHACAIVPLAFGRQILEGLVRLPETYMIEGREVAFADDPIYVAAREQARHASRAQLERIGLFSAEVDAVNRALHAGSKPEDLIIGPSLVTRDASVSEGDDAGELAQPGAIVEELLAAHGAKLAFETRLFPSHVIIGRVQHQLDIVIDGRIVESFAGLGKTVNDALRDALDKFARGSLHVLLATLVGREHGRDQVEWERVGDFELCSGPLLRLWSADPAIHYADVLDAIKGVLDGLPSAVHWVRVFIAIDEDGTPYETIDGLVDNEPHPALVELLRRWPWPRGERAYALRHFFMLSPVDRLS